MSMKKNPEWITVNLPFSESGNEPVYPPGPDLTDQFLDKFGMTPEELEIELGELDSVRAEFMAEFKEFGYDNRDKIAKKMAKKGGDYADYFRLLKLRSKMVQWESRHPKIKAYQDLCKKLRLEGTFEGLGLLRPGVQIEMADGERYLIGSINMNRGIYGDCTAFESMDIVVRYRVLVDFDIL